LYLKGFVSIFFGIGLVFDRFSIHLVLHFMGLYFIGLVFDGLSI